MSEKRAILLINVGTPESTSTSDIRKYLKEFLGDKRVINLSSIPRKILVNGIIAPFRAPKSQKLYQQLWTKNGSPLLHYSKSIETKLQHQLGNDFEVIFGMRYGSPSIKKALETFKNNNVDELIIFPLFPQYASATTGTAIEETLHIIKSWETIPEIRIINQFYNHKDYINAITEKIKSKLDNNFGHILFSYHGLPVKQVFASHKNKECTSFNCKNEIHEDNKYCYHATCYHTSRLLAAKLGLTENDYTTCFQSRFAKNWLNPFTDDIIIEKASNGIKRLLVISPSFVTDCLETTVEIGIEYRQLFKAYGGEELVLVDSLNDDDNWVATIKKIIFESTSAPQLKC